MTNLEFINKEIAITTSKYQQHLKLNHTAFAIKDEKRLQTLQQIKTVLEAWEICKNKKVDIHDIIHCSSLEVFNCYLCKEFQLTKEEYEKIKKALEVEDAN